jgi:hypothetical protein
VLRKECEGLSSNPQFDRWYAAQHVKVVALPRCQLETFGNTLVNYHMLSVLPDEPRKVRIREGRLEAHPPRVIAPHVSEIETEGLGPEARQYLEWLRENEDKLRILQYGYQLKSDNYSEQVVTDSMRAVTDRVLEAVRESNDQFAAVVQGEDEPWDIALVELWRREVMRSAQKNIRELEADGKLF